MRSYCLKEHRGRGICLAAPPNSLRITLLRKTSTGGAHGYREICLAENPPSHNRSSAVACYNGI